ncbi:hypothetical protein Pse7429DRAFT_0197 [Pseudanabaena biceps PCC 7429]|uniref:Uncharacterized protein n=1 Tax=Pseudanabaena biceps PCC 7429 TaxID=927668 RepID=L8N7J7_9CYAN|nr:hypothetical protein Pse7429DRAFT_0197 [Pseudanabaena biceps PCC 7429]
MRKRIFQSQYRSHKYPQIIVLQRIALKPKPKKFLKALLRNAFKNFFVVRLIDNCCNTKAQNGYAILSFEISLKLVSFCDNSPREFR